MTSHPAIRRARAFDGRRRALVRSSDSLAREARRCQRCIGASVGHPNQTSAARGHHRRRRAVLRACGRRLIGRADDGGARRRRRGGPDPGNDVCGALDAARQPARDRGRARLDQRAALAGQPEAPRRQPRAGRARLGPCERLQARPGPRRQDRRRRRRRPRPGRQGERAEQGPADRVARRPGRRRARGRRRREGRWPGQPPRGHRAHARAAHHRPERVGRPARPRGRHAPRPRDGPAGLRSGGRAAARRARSQRPPRLDPRRHAGHELGPGQLRAPGAQPALGGRQDRAQGVRAVRRGPRRRRAAQRRARPGHRLRRPADGGAAHAAGHHRPRLPVDGQRRRDARRRRGRQLPLRPAGGALHRQRPRRRRVQDGHRRPGLPLPADPARRARRWPADPRRVASMARRGQLGLRRLPLRPGRRRALPQGVRHVRRRPDDPAGPSHLRRDRLLRPPEHDRERRAGLVPRRDARAVGGPGVSGRRPRGRRGPLRLVGVEPLPRAAARCRMGRQRPVRTPARQRRRPDADRPRQPLERDGHGGRVRRAHLRALRGSLGGERHPCAPPQRSPARRLGRPRRPAPERRHLLPLARRPRRQPGHRPEWRDRRREGHHHGHRRRPGLRSRRHGQLPDAALPRFRRQLDRAARDRPRDPARALRQPDPGRERQAGHAGEHLEHLRPRRSEPAGLHDQHQLRPGPDRPVQDHGQRRLPDGHLPARLVRRRRGPQGGGDDRVPRRGPGPVPGPADDGARGLRGLVGVRVVGDPARRRLRRLLRPPHRQRRRREPHRLRGPQRPLALGHLLPDVRHHLAGLQRLRRQQPVHGRPADGRQHSARRQGQLQPALRHARRRLRPGLDLQRRGPDDPLAGAQRLRRQLRDRRRHRPLRRR